MEEIIEASELVSWGIIQNQFWSLAGKHLSPQ